MSREPGESVERETAWNSGVFWTRNPNPVSANTRLVWSSYTYAAFVVLRTFQLPSWKVRTLVRVAPVLNDRPPLSIFTILPLVGLPRAFRKFFGTTSV